MSERLIGILEELLEATADGAVRNLLVTGEPYRLDDALYTLRRFARDHSMNLVELDEDKDDWLSLVPSRELFDRLNLPNTVLLVKHYASVNWYDNDNSPRLFLRDLALKRHYGCGNDFVPSDELPYLLFVVALNDKGCRYWTEDEAESFDVLVL